MKSLLVIIVAACLNIESLLKSYVEVNAMTIIQLLVVLIILGVVLYLVNTYIPMDPKIKTIINVIVVLVICGWLLSVFGIFNLGPVIEHGRIK